MRKVLTGSLTIKPEHNTWAQS